MAIPCKTAFFKSSSSSGDQLRLLLAICTRSRNVRGSQQQSDQLLVGLAGVGPE